MNEIGDDVKELLSLGRLEVGHRGDVNDTKSDAMFKTRLRLSFIVVLD